MARPAMLLSLVVVASCLAIESALGCGYQSCPSSYNTSKVQLHVIPHSHDDVGWLKTADGYYDEDVSKVLTNVVHSLQRNPKRKFVEVEIYYFSRWWQRQDKQMQTVVQNLVKSGQLTFANGGWVVHDEASTFYSNIIDQMTLGIQFVRNTFGECAEPKLSWQVDPFGASREVANLYALMGFDGHIVNRGHNLHGEFLWNTSDYNSILTSVLHNHYSAPNGFDFEDGNDITDQNKAQKAKELAELGKKWNVDYGKKGHVLITFGDDFKYQHAEHYYSNLDKIIEEVNKNHPDVNLFYSSPQCYIKAIKDLKPKLEVHSHDYFPLWTGHYSSRPQVKYLDRYANNLLQAAKQLEVTAELSHTQSLIFESSNELGVLQHHDAITGTSREFVTVDYKERLSSAILAASTVISHALGKLINKGAHVSNGLPIIYHTVNISEVDLTFEGGLASIVYNPLVHKQTTWVRIPVSESTNYKVYDFEGKEVPKVSHVPINSKVKSMVGHHRSISYELVFSAKLPALGYTTFFVVKSGSGLSQNKRPIAVNAEQELVMKGKNVELVLDGKTGKVKHLVKGGKVHRLGQSFHYYPSKGTSSSYEFCPSGGSVDLSDYSSSVVSAVQYDGFAEVTQQVNGWIWQTVRLYEDKEYAEFDWIIGPVAEQPDIGKDVITRFETDLDTRKTFWTDANGRQDIERIRDEEPRECHGTHNAISYNYYPITSRALLKDAQSGLELALLTDRSVGASSLEDGQLELMLHRRLLDRKTTDIPVDDRDADGKGVIARGKIIMFFSDKNTAADNYRPMNQILSMQPVIGFVPTSNFTQFRNDHQVQYSALKAPLPENVHLLTLQNWGGVGNNEVLLRLENFYQPHDASKLAVTSTSISVADVFASPKLNIQSLAQTNLVVGSKHNATAAQSGISPSQIASYLVKVNRNVSTSCGLKWEKRLSGGKLPPNAIQAGHESDGRPMYICRHADGDLIPGKYSETIKCHVSLGGGEHAFNDDGVEILTGAEGQYLWAPRHGGDMIAPTAFVAGHNSQGVPIYSGRCVKQERGQVLGKIDPSGGAGYFYYPFGGSEHSDCSNHEILVC